MKLYGLLQGNSDTGVPVTADTAPETVAVMASVRVLSETLACLPLILYRSLDDGKERATEHYLYDILRYQPNAWQSWYEFAEMMTAHIALRGNAYAEKHFNNKGQIEALIPLHPDRTQAFLANGKRAYKHQPMQGAARILLADEVLYIPGLSFNGVSGLDPVTYYRHSVGLARATEMFGGRFFGNDARPSIAIKHPGSLSEPALKNLRESWEERHRGLARSHRPAILEEGMEIQELGVSPENAQFLETRKFQKSEIAGFFRVPPHLIGDLEKATFSNIEHQSRQFVDYTMLPWFTRWEQAIRRDLLTDEEKRTHFVEFLPDALLRGDLKSRYDAYAVGRNWGWLSVNDIRRRENMNPVADGDVYLQPLNMQDAGAPAPEPEENQEPEPEEDEDDAD